MQAFHRNLFLFLFLIITLVVLALVLKSQVSLERIQGHQEFFTLLTQEYFLLTLSLFLLCCLLFINSPVPLAAFIKLIAGAVFGPVLGALLNIIATTLACLAGFLVTRHLLYDGLYNRYEHRLRGINREIDENGFWYFLSVRIMLVIPYFLINIFAGLSRISWKTFTLSTFIGVIPPSIIYAYGGNAIAGLDSYRELFTTDVLLFLTAFALLSLLPVVYRFLKDYVIKEDYHKE